MCKKEIIRNLKSRRAKLRKLVAAGKRFKSPTFAAVFSIELEVVEDILKDVLEINGGKQNG